MLAHLLDLGGEGAIPPPTARSVDNPRPGHIGVSGDNSKKLSKTPSLNNQSNNQSR
jgi:hypothetical protein